MRSDGENFDLPHTLRQVYLPTRQVLSPTISALFSMHTHIHGHMDVLMEGLGFYVRGSAAQRWSSFPGSTNHILEKDGENKDTACFSRSRLPDTTTDTTKHLSKCRATLSCDCFTVHGLCLGSYISSTVRSAGSN